MTIEDAEMRSRSRTRRIVRVLMFLPLVLVFAALFGWVVMWLWNWLMPALFSLKTITYWQAWGLVVLGRILFGGWRGASGGHDFRRRRMARRWAKMSPEQREEFRESFYRGCGSVPPPESKPSA
jgi:hypothetical protein